MRYSMIRLREVTVVRTPDLESVLTGLLRELNELAFDATPYEGILADVAIELEVEHSVLAQIAESCIDGQAISYGSRMLLENDALDGTGWRLPEGTVVDLSTEPGLFTKARMLQRMRQVCRMQMRSTERDLVPSSRVTAQWSG